MSSNARAHRRRLARQSVRNPFLLPDDDVGVMVAWCQDESDLPQARQQLHDAVIALMGERRSGPVSWRWWSGEQAMETLKFVREGATGELADYYRRIAAHLREYGGLLVMASAPGRKVPC